MKPRTLYVSDLDGTLLTSGGRLSATTITLLNHAISRGALISIASARTPATVSHLLRDVNFALPLVVMTGAALWDKTTGKYSDVQYFTPDQVKAIEAAYLSTEGGGAFFYTLRNPKEGKGLMEIYHVGSLNEIERGFMQERESSPFKKFIVEPSGESKIPVKVDNGILFFGMRPNAVADRILSELHKIKGINPMYYHDWYGDDITETEAFPEGATKAKAIKRLKKLAGADRVVVFGDNLNDISMMMEADWSVAVANAVDEVKEIADEVIGINDSDAVVRYILSDLRTLE